MLALPRSPVLVALGWALASCSGGPKLPSASDAELFRSIALLQQAKATFASEVEGGAGDDAMAEAVAALKATAAWLGSQENVASTQILDDAYLDVTFDSGLRHMLWLNLVDENGLSVYRGGGMGRSLARVREGECEPETVAENKTVLLYAPVTTEFGLEFELSATQRRLENAGLSVTVAKDADATPDVYATFPNYGLVFIDSHGAAQGTMSGKTLELTIDDGVDPTQDAAELEQQLLEQLGEEDVARLLTGELFLADKVEVQPGLENWFDASEANLDLGTYNLWVSSRFVKNLRPLTDTIVFNGSCYSGWSEPTEEVPEPIAEAFATLTPASYYGWRRPDGTSKVIDNEVCKQAQRSFITRLVDGECSGGLHLDDTDEAYVSLGEDPRQRTTLCHDGASDRFYEGLCSERPLSDPRGQTYETVCVGGARWMAENLAYPGAGVCYEGVAANCETMGRMYSLEEATGLPTSDRPPVQGLCPDGWHVPSRVEMLALLDAATDAGNGDPLAALGTRKAWPDYADAFNTLRTSFSPVGTGNVVVRFDSDPTQEGQRWSDPASESGRYELTLWSSTFSGPGALNAREYFTLVVLAEYGSARVFESTNAEIIQPTYEYYNQRSVRCVQDLP